jgi:PAS domain S-box-containing protein
MTTPRPPLDPAVGAPAERVGPDGLAQALLDSLPDAIHGLDRDWRITFGNEAFFRHMGMDRADLIGASLWDLIPRSRAAGLEEACVRVIATGVTESFVHESTGHPGRTLDVRVFPMFDGAGIVLRDVTRRVIAERALADSEEHLRRALQGADMGHWSWASKTDRMFLSDRTRALYGLGPEHQGIKRSELRRLVVHPDDAAGNQRAAEAAHASQGQYEAEFRVRRGDGWRWMRNLGGPHIIDGELVGMHGVVQDIHERKLANERLQAEIEERERAQQRQLLLIHELNHRVKNLLAMVQAIAAQTLSNAATPEAAQQALDQRLHALARAHDVLTRESWHGAELTDIIAGAVGPYEAREGLRIRTSGPPVRLEPKAAVTLAMVLHELATNAVKYGALSAEEGWASLDWTVAPSPDGLVLNMTWAEHGGPPVKPPRRKGFGARLIPRSLAAEQGSAELIYASEGVICRMALIVRRPAPEQALRLA